MNVLTAILNPLLEGPFLRMTVFLTLEYCTFWGKKDDNVFCSVNKHKTTHTYYILSLYLQNLTDGVRFNENDQKVQINPDN